MNSSDAHGSVVALRRIATTAALLASLIVGPSPSGAQPTPHATTAGGSHQINALSGCMNQWLFNGIWRLRIMSVAAYNDVVGLPGFKVSFEVRNGSSKSTSMLKTGLPSHPGSLVFDDENELDGTNTDASVAYNNVYFKDVPPSGAMKFTIPFLFQPKPTAVPKPVKWLLQIDPTKEYPGAPRYTTSNPNLRIDLTCTKTS